MLTELHKKSSSPEQRRESLLQIASATIGWGELGLDGSLGYDGRTVWIEGLEPPMYVFLSAHAPSSVRVISKKPLVAVGAMNYSAYRSEHEVTFCVDNEELGRLSGAHETTREVYLPTVCTLSTKATGTSRRHSVWAIRQRAQDSAFRILLTTSNRYGDIAAFSISLLNKYWPNHPPVDVVRHEQAMPRGTEASEFYAGPQQTVSWIEAVRSYLETSSDDEFVLLLLDDYAVCAPVKEEMVSRAHAIMRDDPGISVFYLTWMALPTYERYAGHDDVLVYPAWDWSCHTQAGLWRRSSLIKTLRMLRVGSIDDFEERGSRLYNTRLSSAEKRCGFLLPQVIGNDPLFLDTNDKSEWPIPYHNLVRRGSMDQRHEAFRSAQGFHAILR